MWTVLEQIKTVGGRPQGPDLVFIQPEALMANPDLVLRIKAACAGSCGVVLLQGNEPIARALHADDFLSGPTPSHPLRKEDLALTILKWRSHQHSASSSSTASSVLSAASAAAAAPGAPTALGGGLGQAPGTTAGAGAGLGGSTAGAVAQGSLYNVSSAGSPANGGRAVSGGGMAPLAQTQAQAQPSSQLAQLQQLQQMQAQLAQLQQAKQQQQSIVPNLGLGPGTGSPGSRSTAAPPTPRLLGSNGGAAGAAVGISEIEPVGSATPGGPSLSPSPARPPPLSLSGLGKGAGASESQPGSSRSLASTSTPVGVAGGRPGVAGPEVGDLAAQLSELRRRLEDKGRSPRMSEGTGSGMGTGAGALPSPSTSAGGATLVSPSSSGGTGAGGSAGGSSMGASGKAGGLFSQPLPGLPVASMQQAQQLQLQLQSLQQQKQQQQQQQQHMFVPAPQKGAAAAGGNAPRTSESAAAPAAPARLGGAKGDASPAASPAVRKLGLMNFGSMVRAVPGGAGPTTGGVPGIAYPAAQPAPAASSAGTPVPPAPRTSPTPAQASLALQQQQLQQQLLQLQQQQQQLLQAQQVQQQQHRQGPGQAQAPAGGGQTPFGNAAQVSLEALFGSRQASAGSGGGPSSAGSTAPASPNVASSPAAGTDSFRSNATAAGSGTDSNSVSRSNSFVAAGGTRYRPPRQRFPSPLGGGGIASSGHVSDGYAGPGTSRFASSAQRLGSGSGMGPGGGGGGYSSEGFPSPDVGRSGWRSGAGQPTSTLPTAKSGDDAIAAALASVDASAEEAAAGGASGGRSALVEALGRLEAERGGSSSDGRSALEASFALDDSGGGGRGSVSARGSFSGGGTSSIDLQPSPRRPSSGTAPPLPSPTAAAPPSSPRANQGATRMGSHRLASSTSQLEFSEGDEDAPLAVSASRKPQNTAAGPGAAIAFRKASGDGFGPGPAGSAAQSAVAGRTGGPAGLPNPNRRYESDASGKPAAPPKPPRPPPQQPQQAPSQHLQQQPAQNRAAEPLAGEGLTSEDSDNMAWWSPTPSTGELQGAAAEDSVLVRSPSGSRQHTLDGSVTLGSVSHVPAATSQMPRSNSRNSGGRLPSIDGAMPMAAAGPEGAATGSGYRSGAGSGFAGEVGNAHSGQDRSRFAVSATAANGAVGMGAGSYGSASPPYSDSVFTPLHAPGWGPASPVALPPRPSTPPARRKARILLSSHPIVITREDFLPQDGRGLTTRSS